MTPGPEAPAGFLRPPRRVRVRQPGGPGAATTASAGCVFLTFLRLGITGFGGPAMLHHIRTTVVERKHWLSGDDFKSGLALCQAVPGATGMQVSAYVGLKQAGFVGAAAAYAGFGLPAFVTILALSVLYKYGHNIGTVQSLLTGLQAIVVAIVFNAAIGFGRTSVTRWWQFGVVAGSAAALILRVNPIFVIVGAGIVGLALPVPEAPAGPQKSALPRSADTIFGLSCSFSRALPSSSESSFFLFTRVLPNLDYYTSFEFVETGLSDKNNGGQK